MATFIDGEEEEPAMIYWLEAMQTAEREIVAVGELLEDRP
jgi:hypothetical protein